MMCWPENAMFHGLASGWVAGLSVAAAAKLSDLINWAAITKYYVLLLFAELNFRLMINSAMPSVRFLLCRVSRPARQSGVVYQQDILLELFALCQKATDINFILLCEVCLWNIFFYLMKRTVYFKPFSSSLVEIF